LAQLRIIKNSKRTTCSGCGGVHEYISRPSDHAPCGTPSAFSVENAKKVVPMLAISEDDIVRVPTDTVVVIDDSLRSLPKHDEPDLAHYFSRSRLA